MNSNSDNNILKMTRWIKDDSNVWLTYEKNGKTLRELLYEVRQGIK